LKVYYGLTNHGQLKNMPEDLDIMVSARFLIALSPKSLAFDYLKRYRSVMLDSGAFGCAFYDGGYTYSMMDYVHLVEKVRPALWVTMDYPCEPHIMPNLNVTERIVRTIENTEKLQSLGIPGLLPVIQGWTVEDYKLCVRLMKYKGVIRHLMGIGSICRRGSQSKIVAIVSELRKELPDTKLHAFGVKIDSLSYNNGELLNYLHSLDTAAWQFKMGVKGLERPKRRHDYENLIAEYSKALEARISKPYQLVLWG